MSSSPLTPWTADDTERWLTRFPLPLDFRWDKTVRCADGSKVVKASQPVMPEYRITKGYGFWLRTAPAWPGLFEEIHDILFRTPDDVPLNSEWLVQQLLDHKRALGVQQDLGIEAPVAPRQIPTQ